MMYQDSILDYLSEEKIVALKASMGEKAFRETFGDYDDVVEDNRLDGEGEILSGKFQV